MKSLTVCAEPPPGCCPHFEADEKGERVMLYEHWVEDGQEIFIPVGEF
jgi:hypothetical protein